MNYLYKRLITLTMITLITALAWIYCLSEYKDEAFYIAGTSLAFIISVYSLLNAYIGIRIQQTNEALKNLGKIMLIEKAIYIELKNISLVYEAQASVENQTSNQKNN